MKKLIFAIPFLLFACEMPQSNQGGDNNNNASVVSNDEIITLKNKLRALEGELSEKDASLNDFIETYNEIQDNLAMINLKEDEIRIRSNNVEMGEDGKEWILQEIKNINYLREENENKISILQKELSRSKSSNKDLNKSNEKLKELVTRLQRQIVAQEEEIKSLKQQLDDLDAEYTELFEAYQEQTKLALETMKELNEVYYAYGTKKELIANNVIVQEGGFIGIGRKTSLKDDFDENYFTKIDMYKQTEIAVTGKKIKFVTDHPSSSYKIEGEGESKKIIIEDPTAFWKVSKFLVITVK